MKERTEDKAIATLDFKSDEKLKNFLPGVKKCQKVLEFFMVLF